MTTILYEIFKRNHLIGFRLICKFRIFSCTMILTYLNIFLCYIANLMNFVIKRYSPASNYKSIFATHVERWLAKHCIAVFSAANSQLYTHTSGRPCRCVPATHLIFMASLCASWGKLLLLYRFLTII